MRPEHLHCGYDSPPCERRCRLNEHKMLRKYKLSAMHCYSAANRYSPGIAVTPLNPKENLKLEAGIRLCPAAFRFVAML